MYDILKNLYYVSLLGMLLRFAGLEEPFAVIFGITLLYLAIADAFMPEELDRLRRMGSIAYARRTDVSIAFVAMAGCFGAYYLARGVHYVRFLWMWGDWLLAVGSLGALYVFLHQYFPRRGNRRRLRSIR